MNDSRVVRRLEIHVVQIRWITRVGCTGTLEPLVDTGIPAIGGMRSSKSFCPGLNRLARTQSPLDFVHELNVLLSALRKLHRAPWERHV